MPPTDRRLAARLKGRQLALIIAIAERGTLRRAAAELAVTQPAATKMLHELEAALGASLFERQSSGMRPTPAGEVVVRYARGALTGLGEVRDELAALAAGSIGKLRIGGVTGTVPGLIVPALEAVRRSRRGLRVFMLVNATEVLIEALRDGTLEVAVAPPPTGEAPGDVEIERLRDEPLWVVARPGHRWASRRRLAPPALDAARWILPPPDSALRRDTDAVLRRAGITPGADRIETVSIVATLALLQASDAVALLPEGLASHYRARGQVERLKVALPAEGSGYALITRARRPLSPAAAAFAAEIRLRAARAQR